MTIRLCYATDYVYVSGCGLIIASTNYFTQHVLMVTMETNVKRHVVTAETVLCATNQTVIVTPAAPLVTEVQGVFMVSCHTSDRARM